jgi:Tol biopolymer transport system component
MTAGVGAAVEAAYVEAMPCRNRHVIVVLVAALVSVIAAGSLFVSAGRTTAGADDRRILLMSNRDGQERPYSVDEDGSDLTPLFPPGHRLVPVEVSRDGGAIAYTANNEAPAAIYVSRADGSGLRRLVPKGFAPAFSPDGRLLAIGTRNGIWIVGADGRGLRRLTSGADGPFDWSPDGRALVFMRVIDAKSHRYAVVVQPLRGKERVLVRTGPNEDNDVVGWYQPSWSSDGRWIAYYNLEEAKRENGLTLVRPNGKSRHRVVRGSGDELDSGDFPWWSWSPDGRWIAFKPNGDPELDYVQPNGGKHRLSAHAFGPVVWSPDGMSLAFSIYVNDTGQVSDVAVANGDGRGLRRLQLGLANVWEWGITWSPDGSSIAFAGGAASGDPLQIWVVDRDGTHLHA